MPTCMKTTRNFSNSTQYKERSTKMLIIYVTCALMSDPKSNNNLTVGVWPFIAANISGDIPSLLPVLYIIETMKEQLN